MAGFGELGEEGQAGQTGAQHRHRQEGALGRDWWEMGTVQGPEGRSDSGRPRVQTQALDPGQWKPWPPLE